MAGRIAIVDGADRFLRWEGRKRVHDERQVHRSIHVALLDAQGRLVIQRRHRAKQTYPSHWDLSAAGHVEESDYGPGGPDADLDRVYREVAGRELEEELGVRPALTELGHITKAQVDQMYVDDIPPTQWRLACQMIVRDEDILVEYPSELGGLNTSCFKKLQDELVLLLFEDA